MRPPSRSWLVFLRNRLIRLNPLASRALACHHGGLTVAFDGRSHEVVDEIGRQLGPNLDVWIGDYIATSGSRPLADEINSGSDMCIWAITADTATSGPTRMNARAPSGSQSEATARTSVVGVPSGRLAHTSVDAVTIADARLMSVALLPPSVSLSSWSSTRSASPSSVSRHARRSRAHGIPSLFGLSADSVGSTVRPSSGSPSGSDAGVGWLEPSGSRQFAGCPSHEITAQLSVKSTPRVLGSPESLLSSSRSRVISCSCTQTRLD